MFFFAKRRKLAQVQQLIGRLIDRSTPNLRKDLKDLRCEQRYNRSLPVLIVPMIEGKPKVQFTGFGVTQNISNKGVALLSQQPIKTEEALVGFWQDGACDFVLADIRHRSTVEGGYWQIGLELSEVVLPGDFPELDQLSVLAGQLVASDTAAELDMALAAY